MSEHEVWNEFGNIYFQIGAYEESAGAFNKAIALNPEKGWYYNSLALVYANKGNYVEAIALYQKSLSMLEGDADRAVVWSRLGNVYELINDYEKSIEAYQRAAELDPINFDVEAIAEAEEAGSGSDDPAEAVELGSQSDWMPIPEVDPSTPESEFVIEEANLAAAGADGFAKADEADVRERDDEDKIAKLVEELIAQDQEADARAENRMMEADARADVQTENRMMEADVEADARAENRMMEADVEADARVENRMVDDLEAVIVTGELSVEDVTIFDRAEEMIEVIANDPAGEIVDEAEEGIEAGDPLSAALASNPIIAEAEVPAPTPAKQPSYLNDAVAFMIELTRLAPANDGAWDTLGNLYRASGCYAEAIESFQQAISLDMNNEEYFYHLGLAFAGQDRHEEAIAAFERTIALKPDHSMAHSALAGHYRKVGRDAESIKHIKQALPKLTDEQDYSRACFEAISGNTDLAIALLQAALEKKQITMEWVRRDPDLDFIRNDPRYISIVGD